MRFENFGYLLIGIILSLIYLIYYLIVRKEKIETSALPHLKQTIKVRSNIQIGLDDILFALNFFLIISMFLGFSNPYIDSSTPKNGINIVLLIDKSGTMQQDYGNATRLDIAKNLSKTILKFLDSEDYIAILEFGYDVEIPLCLSNPGLVQISEIIDSIEQTDELGSLADGIYDAVDLVSSTSKSTKLIFLLSDGINQDRIFTINQSLEHAKEKNVPIYTVDIGSKDLLKFGYGISEERIEAVEVFLEPDDKTLKYIANATGGLHINSSNIKSLNDIYEEFRKEIKKEKKPYYLGIYSFALAFVLFLIHLILTEIRSINKKNEKI